MKTAPDIRLSREEREQLQTSVRTGKHSACVPTRARILLLAAERSLSSRGGKTRRSNSNRTIGEDLLVSARTVSRVRQRFVKAGWKAALYDRERWRSRSKTGQVGLFRSTRGSQSLDSAVVGRSDGGVRIHRAYLGYMGIEATKKNKLRPWAIKSWCIPKVSTRFIAKMEDVLAVYQRPYTEEYPMVCLDEKGKELQSQRVTWEAELPKPGAEGMRQDYEYQRQGSANILLVCEPLKGWRRVSVTQDRTAHSLARQLRQDEFTAVEARRIAEKIEWHYPPEHGSWLNRAELELSAMQRQCLNRRFADFHSLEHECQAWAKTRNQDQVKIKWQFSNADARIRLHRLYPDIKYIS